MRIKLLFLIPLLVLCLARQSSADAITYAVSVNTSSILGDAGSLDFQFNPGPLTTQAADLEILGFASDGTLDPAGPVLTGDATGALPGTLLLDNGSGFNDYFQDFTFGSVITFDVSLLGPALTNPDGMSSSGSTFAFSMFSDPGGATPALTSDMTNGFAFTTAVNLDGTTTPANSSATALSYSVVPTPEPSSVVLLASGLAMLFALVLRSRLNRSIA